MSDRVRERRGLGDPTRHLFMTRGVARSMGLNLAEELQAGRLRLETYSAMVTRCRACGLLEACQEWLASRTELSRSAPPGCCNSEVLCSLRKAAEAEGRLQ